MQNRFWRKEDVAEVRQCLEKGIPVTNAPGWIKNLIMGIEDTEVDEINEYYSISKTHPKGVKTLSKGVNHLAEGVKIYKFTP